MLSKRGTVARIYLPPDANTLIACADHCLRSRIYVNLIAIDKQPQLQWLDMDAAIERLALGASVWEWASNVPEGEEPDIVLGCAGEIPTLEIVAAAHWLRPNSRCAEVSCAPGDVRHLVSRRGVITDPKPNRKDCNVRQETRLRTQ